MKKNLKKIALLNDINAKIKCVLLKRNYRRLQEKYGKESSFNTIDKVFDSEWLAQVKSKEKPTVYFVGTCESQDRGGLIPDLQKLADLELFHKYDGGYGQYSGLLEYSGRQGRALNTQKFIDDIERLIQEKKEPDIVLMQAWGRTFEIDRILEYKKERRLKIVNISLDDRLVFEANTPKHEAYNYGIVGLVPVVDLFLVSNPEVVNWYRNKNVNAIFWPMASSLKYFHPTPSKQKIYDVGFIGNKYGYRGELVNYLIESGIQVRAYGRGWPDGFLDSSKANEFFNECKVVLGIGTVGHCQDFFTQKLRDFDAPLSGSIYITNSNPDLLSLYSDNEIILAEGKEDFSRKIKELLSNAELRESIAQKAFKTASHKHTYEKRFKDLFSVLGIMNDSL